MNVTEPGISNETPRHGLRWALLALLMAVAAFLVLLVVVNGMLFAYYSWQVGKRVAALRRAGEPVYLEEVRVPEVAEAENAWGDYVRLFHITGDPSVPGSSRARGLGEMSESQYGALTGYATSDAELGKLLHAPEVRRSVAALKTASLKPQMVRPLDKVEGGQVFAQWHSFSSAILVCRNLALASALQGDIAQATELLLIGLRVSRHVTDDRGLMAQLVALSMYSRTVASVRDVLMRGIIPQTQSSKLRQELSRQEHQVISGIVRSSAFERAYDMTAYRKLQWSPRSGARLYHFCLKMDRPKPAVMGMIASAIAANPVYWKRQQMILLDVAGRLIELSKTPTQHLPQLKEMAASGDRPSVDLAMGKATSARVMMHTLLQQMRMNQLSVALALNDYYREHGRYPERLAELPQPLPGDVLSGEGFRYRRVGGKYLLYAIGADRRDDGGKGKVPLQAGDAGDWVWRVERRR